MIKLSRAARGVLGLVASALLVVVGLAMAVSVPAALITAGVLAGGYFLVLYDADESGAKRR